MNIIERILQYDTDLFIYLNGLGVPAWDGFWLVVTNKLTFIPLYLVLIVLLFRKTGVKKGIWALICVALMITFTDQVTNVFKYGFERLRPCHNPDISGIIRIVRKGCGGRFGFFSAHAANSFAVAVFMGSILKKYYSPIRAMLILWAFFVGYSRIYVGVHYPLDVLCGALFGAASGWLFYRLLLFAERKYLWART